MATRRVIENVDTVNDDVVCATESRCYPDVHVVRDLLPGEVAGDHGPFSQPRINDLIELRHRKVAGSFRTDIIECHKPVTANGMQNLIVAVPQMIDDFTPSDESTPSAQVSPCFRVEID